MAQNGFRIDPTNYLGLDHETYQRKIYSIALSKPSYFFLLRERVDSSVKKAVIKNLYSQIYWLLTEGALATPDGEKGQQIITDDNGQPISPAYPLQLTNQITLGLSKTLENALDDIINHLLPLKFDEILKSKLTSQGNASIV